MQWNIVWQVDPNNLASCIERDWFNELTSLVPIGVVKIDYDTRPLLKAVMSNSIVCASCPNQATAADLTEYMRELPRPRVLYHFSDEYVEVGHEVYEHCDLVIRNGSLNGDVLHLSKFLQIPMGFATGLGNASRDLRPASLRKCSWAFLGTLKHDRGNEMLGALNTIDGARFVRRTKSFADSTRHFGISTIAVYKNAVFVPAPKGNWNPECNRLYDALEWGCIPLIKRYKDSEYHATYYERLLGEHPIPVFDEWQQAASFANDLLSNKPALDALQARVFDWWQEYKEGLRVTISNRLASLST